MRAMIMAAGRGTRMRPLSDSIPKPLLQVGGRPLIEYHLENLASVGVREVVINTAWQAARIHEALGDGSRFGLRIVYSDEGEVAFDSGGGIHRALPMLGRGPFLVLNGDTWTGFLRDVVGSFGPDDCLRSYAHARLSATDLLHLVLVPNPPDRPRGDFALDGGRVRAEGARRWTFGGIAIYRPELFAECVAGTFSVVPLIRRAIAENRASGELYRGVWHNVESPRHLERLDALIRGGGLPGGFGVSDR